jgi:bifunctional DNase/RNase
MIMEFQKSVVRGVFVGITDQGMVPMVLLELGDSRFVPIYVGFWEALSIASALKKEMLPRPITHDLILEIFNTYSIEVKGLQIDNLEDGIFYSNLILSTTDGERIIDCRPSDGIAIVTRIDGGIQIADSVIDKAAVDHEQIENLREISEFLE